MHAEPRDPLKIYLGLVVIGTSVLCIVLPIIGAHGFFAEFRQPYSGKFHFHLLSGQLLGPVFMFLLSSSLVVLVWLRKFVAWWLWPIVLLGPLYTARAVRGVSHDFSHTVFKECSGIYGTWIHGLCILGAASLILLAVLTRSNNRRL